ncbi:ogr/Delta-like zinc finger family protein [Gilliamella apicola]
MKCPQCQNKTFIRSSEEISNLTRKQYYLSMLQHILWAYIYCNAINI